MTQLFSPFYTGNIQHSYLVTSHINTSIGETFDTCTDSSGIDKFHKNPIPAQLIPLIRLSHFGSHHTNHGRESYPKALCSVHSLTYCTILPFGPVADMMSYWFSSLHSYLEAQHQNQSSEYQNADLITSPTRIDSY